MSRANRIVLSTILLSFTAALAACASDAEGPDSVDESAIGGDDVASDSFAICGTTPAVNKTLPLASSGDVASITAADSPDTSYANASPYRYTLQLGGIKGQKVETIGEWAYGETLPSNQTSCEASRVLTDVYGYNPAMLCWEKLGTKIGAGVWTHVFFFGNSWWECEIGAGGIKPDTTKYTALRVSGRAYQYVTFQGTTFVVNRRVSVGAWNRY